MGNCVPVNKSTGMKVAVQFESPNKENTAKTEQMHNSITQGFFPQTSSMEHVPSFRDLSSEEEMFFDSQPWLDSDCEDYFSVNGDLTPSLGNTPVHPKSSIGTPQCDKVLYVDSTPISMAEPSPTTTEMKKLIELFRESFNDDQVDEDQNLHRQQEAKPTIFDLSPKSAGRSPYESVTNSVYSSERTPYIVSDSKKKSSPSSQCCIPSLMRSLSFTERKKRLSSANNSRWQKRRVI